MDIWGNKGNVPIAMEVANLRINGKKYLLRSCLFQNCFHQFAGYNSFFIVG